MGDMKCFINDHYVSESYFWHAVQGMVGQSGIERLMAGQKLLIGGVTYQIVFE